jgi:hypothetical protein
VEARLAPFSRQTSARPKTATVNAWVDYWRRRDAWTLREFAFLCCGWNPSEYHFEGRDQALYNEAVESINRAVRVGVLDALRLAWPATGAERMYDSVPAFKPSQVAAWAVKHYPAFPYRNDPWLRETIGRNLQALRKECGLTVEQLADRAGKGRRGGDSKPLEKSNVQDHLNGRVQPNGFMMAAYATCFSKELSRKITVAGLMKEWPDQVCPTSPPRSTTP